MAVGGGCEIQSLLRLPAQPARSSCINNSGATVNCTLALNSRGALDEKVEVYPPIEHFQSLKIELENFYKTTAYLNIQVGTRYTSPVTTFPVLKVGGCLVNLIEHQSSLPTSSLRPPIFHNRSAQRKTRYFNGKNVSGEVFQLQAHLHGRKSKRAAVSPTTCVCGEVRWNVPPSPPVLHIVRIGRGPGQMALLAGCVLVRELSLWN